MAIHHAPQEANQNFTFDDLPLDEAKKMLRQMLLIRRFEEATIKGYQQRKISGFLHTYIGQEALGVGILAHKEAEDSVVTSYRCHGLGLAIGMDVNACMAELYGKVTGCVRGKGGSMHYFDKELGLLGGHGIVGGQDPIGVGSAFEMKYNNKKNVSFTHFGDGSVPQGTFHESMNLASLWNLPVIFVCEDNQYAMGTNKERILSNLDVAKIGEAYNMKGYTLDGMNLAEVYIRMKEIVAEVRETSKPVIIHGLTYRFRGHSVSDAALYRTKDEENEWKGRDPIVDLNSWMIEKGHMTEQEVTDLDKEIKKEVKAAIKFAEKSPLPPLEDLSTHTYFDDVGAKYGY